MTLKNFDRVRVVAIRDDRFSGMPDTVAHWPKVGDVAYIIDTHETGHVYEVECSNPSSGETLWLEAMYIDELLACRS